VPTIAESDVTGYDTSAWWGIAAPAKTPAPVVNRLAAEIAEAVQSEELKARLQEIGIEALGVGPEEFAAFQKSEIAKCGKAVKESGAKVD
jgi:tripartite-type tricarboxylate transporter receptor subunit TctC